MIAGIVSGWRPFAAGTKSWLTTTSPRLAFRSLPLAVAGLERCGGGLRRSIKKTVEAMAVTAEAVQQFLVGGKGVIAAVCHDLGIDPCEIDVFRDRLFVDGRDVAQFRDIEDVEGLAAHIAFEAEGMKGILEGANVVLLWPQLGREWNGSKPLGLELAA